MNFNELFDLSSYARLTIIFTLVCIELHQPRTGLINLDAVEQKIVELRELLKG